MFHVTELDDWGNEEAPSWRERLVDGLDTLSDDEVLRGPDC